MSELGDAIEQVRLRLKDVEKHAMVDLRWHLRGAGTLSFERVHLRNLDNALADAESALEQLADVAQPEGGE